MVGLCSIDYTSTMLWTKSGLMLAHRLWRWPTFSVKDGGTTLTQHWVNVACLTTFLIESAGQTDRNEWHTQTERTRQTDSVDRGKPTCPHLCERGEKTQFANTQRTQNICIACVQRRPNVFTVEPTMYKCHMIVLCLLGGMYEIHVVTEFADF